MLKHTVWLLVAVYLCGMSVSALADTEESNLPTITLVNHTNGPLRFVVSQGDELTANPRLSKEFQLDMQGSISTHVRPAPQSCKDLPSQSNNTVYIMAKGDADKQDAFFSFGTGCPDIHRINISGYNDTNIAYSWNQGTSDATITFCEPQDYSPQNGCS